jgi:hypothetical protein
MPRKNRPVKHTQFQFVNNEAGKTRYSSQAAAQKAADLRMLQNPGLELTVYQATDGSWYLTRLKDGV